MMNALLVLALLTQDADLSVTGKAKREDKEYELTVSGKGKSLQDHDQVRLRFTRFANRLNWADGSITTEAIDDDSERVAPVEKHAFTHPERFPTAGDVEVRIGLGPEGFPIRRMFRTASPHEAAHAIAADAKQFDAALHGAGQMIADVEALKKDPAPPMKRQGRLQKRVDWRKNAYRQEIAHSFLTASAHALSLWMEDVENAAELEQAGKDHAAMLSSLSGKPFTWEEARAQLSTIEAVSLRERALLIVREIVALGRDIAAAVAAGDAASFTRKDKDFTKTLEMLREDDGVFRKGPFGGRYAALVDLNGSTIDDLAIEASGYLQAGAGCVHCAPSSVSDFDELGRKLMDRAAAFEVRIRTQP
jgi:hypothetical protein